jgi:hypothetical protein
VGSETGSMIKVNPFPPQSGQVGVGVSALFAMVFAFLGEGLTA